MKKVLTILGSALAGGIIGIVNSSKLYQKELQDLRKKADRDRKLITVYDQWMLINQEGKSIANALKSQGFCSAAIYGIGILGERVYAELRNSGINIDYLIDKNITGVYIDDVVIYKPEDKLPQTDAIIVTPIFFYEEIKKDLQKENQYPILSFEDILYKI